MPVRSVRRLRVRAGTEDEAQRAAVLLGDALRTASLPLGDDGRLVVVRHLPLGRISIGVSPASLALHIERVARDVMASAVACDQPAAPGANAVVFRNPADAVVAAARVLASDGPADEWFWPRVIPGWSDTPRTSRWPLLIEAAHRLRGAPVVAAAIVHEAVQSESGRRFVSSIATADAASWLRVAGWHEWSTPPPTAAPPRVTPFRAAAIAQWRQRAGPVDDRLVWLGTMLAVYDNPACAGDAHLPARILASLSGDAPAIVAPAVTSTVAPPGTDRPPRPDAAGEPHRGASIDATAPAADEPPADDAVLPAIAEQAKHMPLPAPSPALPPLGDTSLRTAEVIDTAQPQPPSPTERLAPDSAGACSECGGLLFVVPILERLGFAAFMTADSRMLDEDFPARLLWSIGRRAGMSLDDPFSPAFAREPVLTFPLRDLRTLPAAAQQILSMPRPRGAVHSAIDAWTMAVRRWSRRHARQGLISLIRRSARVHVSRSHVDVDFQLSQADVRVRRVALDVDPGWVPWLGHVVHFTYSDRR